MTSSRIRSLSSIFIILISVFAWPATAWLQEQPSGAAPGSLVMPGTTAETPDAADTQGATTARQTEYLIKEKDTLWDIAADHYRDPFLWPLIWQANQSIKNADLIYPGQLLIIPSLAPIERAMNAPQEPATVQEKSAAEPAQQPKTRTEPETTALLKPKAPSPAAEPEEPVRRSRLILPEETAPPIVDKITMISAGFVSEEKSEDYIIGSADDPEKSILSHDERVYISIHSRSAVNAGDRFLIFQPDHKVKHPVTKRDFGVLYRILGILKVTKANAEGSTTATAAITNSFDAAEKGSLLMPYQEPLLVYPTSPKPVKNVSGHILDVPDRRSINAQTYFVYLDKGKEDGVAPGDRFIVYENRPDSGSGMSKMLGEVEVFLVKQRTSTAIVRKSVDALGTGDRYMFKN